MFLLFVNELYVYFLQAVKIVHNVGYAKPFLVEAVFNFSTM